MSRYTDTDELLKELNSCKYSTEKLTKKQEAYNSAISDMCRSIDATPNADVVEVKHGRWVEFSPLRDMFSCSLCGQWGDRLWNYCPHCGAKMDLGD